MIASKFWTNIRSFRWKIPKYNFAYFRDFLVAFPSNFSRISIHIAACSLISSLASMQPVGVQSWLPPNEWRCSPIRDRSRDPELVTWSTGRGNTTCRIGLFWFKKGQLHSMRFYLFLKILVSSDLSQWALHFKMFASEIEFLARTLGTLTLSHQQVLRFASDQRYLDS